MKILKIKLENIKSYESGPTVEFHPGVNFISGKNGSGKTTLLESIGYAIFDYSPYSNISKMIREGTSWGKIIVWFCFDDEIVYRSERRIGSGGRTWTIYEEGDETEIVSGANETKEWIREKIGVPEDMDISRMYSDIIGVSQGEITTYFKMTSETKRKDHFNPIIGVEDYRNAYTASSSVPTKIQMDIKDIVSQIDQIKVRTEKYNERKDDFNKIKTGLQKIKKEVANKNKEFSIKEKQLESTENIKDKLNQLEKKRDIIEQTISGEEDKLGKLKREVMSSQKASIIIERTQKGYETYKAASQQINEVESERKEKQELEKKKNSLLINIKSSLKELEADKRNLEKNLKTKKKNIEAEKKKIKTDNKPYQKSIKDLKKVENEIEPLRKIEEDYLEELKKIIDTIKQGGTEIRKNESEIGKRSKTIKRLKKEIKKLGQLEDIKKTINELKKVIQAKERNETAISMDIESFSESISKGGICFILNESCKRISEPILSGKIEESNKQLNKIRNELNPLKKKLENFEKQKDILVKLEGKKDQIKDEETEIMSLRKENTELKSKIKLSNINPLVKEIKSTFASINLTIDIKELKSIKNIQKSLPDIIKFVNDKLKTVKTTKNKKRIELEKIKSSFETKVKKSNEIITSLEGEIKKSEDEKFEIESRQAEIDKNKEKLKSIIESLKPLANVEKELNKLRKIIMSTEEKYSEYTKNIKEAGMIEEKKRQLAQVSTSLKNNKKISLSTKKGIATLKPKFKEETYKVLKQEVNTLREEKTKVESKLEEFERDNKRLLKEIKEMEEEMKKIKILEKDKGILEEVFEVIQFIRETLNAVGRPIAQRYLSSISASANMIYNTLSDEKVELSWEQDYMIRVKDYKGIREFRQLSGGEQMSAALSIQLALAKEFSNVGVAIFDEPTSNLDETRCDFLADTIGKVRDEYGFNQLFIISHDETFSSLTEQEIHLEKIKGKTSLV